MRIIGGAIGPVIAIVIITSILIPIEVDGVTGQYPSPSAFNIVFIVGLVLAIVATILVGTYAWASGKSTEYCRTKAVVTTIRFLQESILYPHLLNRSSYTT